VTGTGNLVAATSPTLTTPHIVSIVNTGTLTLPTSSDTLVGRATTDTLTNKTMTSSTDVLGGVTMTLGSDATGDIYYNNANILTRLPKGTNGQALELVAGLPAWATLTGTGTVTSVTCNGVAITTSGTCSTIGQVPGTATNDNASSGNVGEYIATSSIGSSQTSTVTITIASPAVITWTANGFVNSPIDGNVCTPVNFTTTGALPTGLTAGTTYYVIGSTITTNTFEVATSVANCVAGTAVNTSGTQSGTQTAINNAPLTNNAAKDITGVSLTAGDWRVCGVIASNVAGATTMTGAVAWIATASVTQPTNLNAGAYFVFQGTFQTGGNAIFPIGCKRISIASTTTVFLSTIDLFSGGTNAGYGFLGATRIR
jgi:hypothetical protein